MKLVLPVMALSVAMLLIWTLVTPVVSVGGEADGGDVAQETQFDLVGAKKCKMCHKPAKIGNQWTVWTESKHAEAYEVLASDAALAIATEKGIENPQTAPECLKCHVTAFPVIETIADQKITLEEGVSCETCHGPGSGYWKKKMMAAIRAGTQDAAEVGLTKPTEEQCKSCHNEESPTYKEFKFDEYWAKIAHGYPAEGE